MAWTGKVEAKDLIGLTKEEMEAKVAEINATVSKVTALEAANSSLGTQVDTIKASLAALEGKVGQPPVAASTPTADPNAPKYDWSEDADNAFNHRAAPLAQKTLQIEAQLNFDRVMKRLVNEKPIYAKLENEARALIEKEPLQHRGVEKVIEYAFKIALAENSDAIAQDQAKRSGKFFTESGENQTSSTNSNDPAKGLSEAEKAQAAKFGMTPEAYAASKGTMTFVR